MSAAQQSYNDRLKRVEALVPPNSDDVEKTNCIDSSSEKQDIYNQGSSDAAASSFRLDGFSALRMRFLRQHKCDASCDCSCHIHTRARSPQMLQSLVGSLFVGYICLPALASKCSVPKCQRSSEGFLQIDYLFPPWFLARMVSMAMTFKDSKIPDLSIRVLNVRSSYEPIFQNAREGGAGLVRHLLTMGQASVQDVTHDSGHSPLHVGTTSHTQSLMLILGSSLLSEKATWK